MVTKAIRLDFSKVEERGTINSKHIPEGLHKMRIDNFDDTEASDGVRMLVFYLVPTDARYKTRRFAYYCKLQANQLWKLRDLLVAAGISVPKSAFNFKPDAAVGKLIAAEVEDETNATYAGRSNVTGTYGLDILDEDGSIADEGDDEADEEYEGDEETEPNDEPEEEPEDEEEYEDDEPEDLSALGLPELRKRAKGLQIDIAGLKKAELIEAIEEAEAEEAEDEDELEEDDLDDEELEEEEFEDDEEEEEEAPAPRKRPAAKAPAAKAAPARRVVKRR